jgi:hypothetical protein
MLPVPILLTLQTHEELTTVVVSTIVSHRQHTAIVTHLKRLVREPTTRRTLVALAAQSTALHTLTRHDAMEHTTLVATTARLQSQQNINHTTATVNGGIANHSQYTHRVALHERQEVMSRLRNHVIEQLNLNTLLHIL